MLVNIIKVENFAAIGASSKSVQGYRERKLAFLCSNQILSSHAQSSMQIYYIDDVNL